MPSRNPHFNAKHLGELGGARRAETLTAAERSIIAQKGALARWYHNEPDVGDQVEGIIRGLTQVASRGLQEENDHKYLRALTVLLPYLRLKLLLQTERQVNEGATVEMDEIGAEAVKKYEEAKKGKK